MIKKIWVDPYWRVRKRQNRACAGPLAPPAGQPQVSRCASVPDGRVG